MRSDCLRSPVLSAADFMFEIGWRAKERGFEGGGAVEVGASSAVRVASLHLIRSSSSRRRLSSASFGILFYRIIELVCV